MLCNTSDEILLMWGAIATLQKATDRTLHSVRPVFGKSKSHIRNRTIVLWFFLFNSIHLMR